jgi:acetyltransferase
VPDFLAIAVPSQKTVGVIREAAQAGVKGGLIIGGGFGEGAGEGKDIAAEIKAICDTSQMKLCGPNCYGVLNVHDQFAGFSGDIVDPLTPGSVAFVIQSGAVSHAVHDSAIGRGLGISAIVTSGNELVCELSEYVDWFIDHAETRVIGVFIEGLKDPTRFARVAQRALEKGKPIVALKVGRSEKGQRSTLAHTGSVAGSDESYEGLFKRHGVVRVQDLDEYLETLLLMSSVRRPRTSGVALASISGGLTTLVSDLAEDAGVNLPAIGEATTGRLKAALPGFGLASNPLDTTGLLAEKPEILPKVISAFLEDEHISAFGLLFNTPKGCDAQRDLYVKHAQMLAQAQSSCDKPVFGLAAISGPVDPEVVTRLADAQVPFIIGARAGLRAVKNWTAYEEARSARITQSGALASGLGLRQESAASMFVEREAMDWLEQYGLRFPERRFAHSTEEAIHHASELGYPVALKIDSPTIAHKTEIGGVQLGVRSAEAVREAYATILARASTGAPEAVIRSVCVQKMSPSGVELLIGVTRDPQFGLQLAVGPGGIFVELLRSAQVRQIPISRRDAEEMLDTPVLNALLGGFRGQKPADVPALIEAMLAVSNAASDLGGRLADIDLNPVIVRETGNGVLALDALIVFAAQSDIQNAGRA